MAVPASWVDDGAGGPVVSSVWLVCVADGACVPSTRYWAAWLTWGRPERRRRTRRPGR